MELPWKIMKSSDFSSLEKKVSNLETALINRPVIDFTAPDEYSNLYPKYPVLPHVLYSIYHASDVWKNIIGSLRFEIFRNGVSFQEKFACKCSNSDCGKEFDYEIKECDECGSSTVVADESQLKLLKFFVDSANENNETLIDVQKRCNDDLELLDDFFVLLSKEYSFFNDRIVGAIPKELIHLSPLYTFFVADKQGRLGYDLNGTKKKFCVIHRQTTTPEDFCPVCGKETVLAAFEFRERGGKGFIYYSENEVFHSSKYNPSLLNGYPIGYSVWQKILILLNMDKLLKDWYKGQRMPRGLLFLNSANQEAINESWSEMLARVEKNPNLVFPIGVESNSQRGQVAQWVKLMDSLQEMTFIQSRVQLIREIGAVYNVAPLFLNDTSASGGLNNEGLQITVTNRGVEAGQEPHNKFFKWLLKQFNVSDWLMELNPSEERDEMAELQRDAQKIQNMNLMLQAGFDVDLDETDSELSFKFSGKAQKQDLSGMLGGFQSESQGFQGLPQGKELSKQEKIPLSPGEKPPEGSQMVTGPRGGKYYVPQKKPGVSSEDVVSRTVGTRANSSEEARRQWQGKKLDGQPITVTDVIESVPGVYDVSFEVSEVSDEEKKVIDKVKKYFKEPETKEWVKKVAEFHVNMPKDKPVFVFGRHEDESKQLKETIDLLNEKGVQLIEIPSEFKKKTGEVDSSKPDRDNYNNFLNDLFEGRTVVDMHSYPPGSRERPGAFFDVFNVEGLKNYVGIEFPSHYESEMDKKLLENLLGDLKERSKPKEVSKADFDDEFLSKLNDELKDLFKKISRKKNLSEAGMKKRIKGLVQKFQKNLIGKTDKALKDAYKTSIQEVESDLGIDIGFGEVDKNALNVIRNSRPLSNAYSGLNERLSKNLNEVIEKNFSDSDFSLSKMVSDMQDVVDESEGSLNRIARTESHNIRNLARENSYDKVDEAGELKFKWIGPKDSRTTKFCQKITNRTKNGVTRKELREIIREEADQETYMASRPYSPHINCRHSFVRYFGD